MTCVRQCLFTATQCAVPPFFMAIAHSHRKTRRVCTFVSYAPIYSLKKVGIESYEREKYVGATLHRAENIIFVQHNTRQDEAKMG